MPVLAWLVAVIVELIGGLALLFRLSIRATGLVLAIWCVVTGLVAHTNFADRAQEIQFWKNMAMTGGFFTCFALGPASKPGPAAHALSLTAGSRLPSPRIGKQSLR